MISDNETKGICDNNRIHMLYLHWGPLLVCIQQTYPNTDTNNAGKNQSRTNIKAVFGQSLSV